MRETRQRDKEMKRESDKETKRQSDFVPESPRLRVSVSLICSACGSESERRFAKFCRVCGKLLREDYQPLDNLRASYRLQGKNISHAESKLREEKMASLFEKDE